MQALLEHPPVRLLIALAIGLLAGLERERQKGEGPQRGAAGIRTFAIASLIGGVAGLVDSAALIVVSGAFVGAAALASYWRGDPADPGLTTELALFLVYVLGIFSIRDPGLAVGAGIVTTALLAFRTRLHHFARSALTDRDVLDGLVLGLAALVVLPVLPDRAMGPFGAINPARVWRLVVMVMAVGIASRIGVRLLGARAGLALAGLAGGSVSSTATIGSMAGVAKRDTQRAAAATAGAVLANVSSLAQLALVVGVSSRDLLSAIRWPLIAGGGACLIWGLVLALRSHKGSADSGPELQSVDLPAALGFAASVAAVLVVVAFLQRSFGAMGFLIGAIGLGAADVHAAAISASSAAAGGSVPLGSAIAAVLGAISANAVVKLVVAAVAGSRAFAWRVAAGLIVLVAAMWAAYAFV